MKNWQFIFIILFFSARLCSAENLFTLDNDQFLPGLELKVHQVFESKRNQLNLAFFQDLITRMQNLESTNQYKSCIAMRHPFVDEFSFSAWTKNCRLIENAVDGLYEEALRRVACFSENISKETLKKELEEAKGVWTKRITERYQDPSVSKFYPLHSWLFGIETSLIWRKSVYQMDLLYLLEDSCAKERLKTLSSSIEQHLTEVCGNVHRFLDNDSTELRCRISQKVAHFNKSLNILFDEQIDFLSSIYPSFEDDKHYAPGFKIEFPY